MSRIMSGAGGEWEPGTFRVVFIHASNVWGHHGWTPTVRRYTTKEEAIADMNAPFSGSVMSASVEEAGAAMNTWKKVAGRSRKKQDNGRA